MNRPNHPEESSDGEFDQKQLLDRYERIEHIAFRKTLRLYCKRALWVAVVRLTYLVKRLFDIIASAFIAITHELPVCGRCNRHLPGLPSPVFSDRLGLDDGESFFP